MGTAEEYPVHPVAAGGTDGTGDTAEAARLRAGLLEEMRESGVPADPRWAAAFARVPRHLFVPAFWVPRAGTRFGPGRPPGADELERLAADDPDPGVRERWLRTAYRDSALATVLEDGRPVSSSSQPSLMALMLDALRVADGMRVLEIGTGTGYNAGLLAAGLGDGAVVSVDLDESITAPARERLAAAGLGPDVVTGDGAAGVPALAPFDRVLATCALPAVPVAWLRQLRVGGVVLAPLLSGLVRVTLRPDGTARGRFLDTAAFFVALRGGGDRGAAQAGDARAVHEALGEGRGPARPRFGLTVEEKRQWVWLDDPSNPVHWLEG